MATAVQLRRGTTGQVGSFTGLLGECVVNTTTKTLVVNDGETAGGIPLARADFDNISASATLTLGTLSATQVDITAQGDLRLQDTTGGEYAALQAPGTVSASYTLTMPSAVGASGQALRASDGAGVLEWYTPADVGDITSVVAGAGLTGGGTSGAVTLNAIGTADRVSVSADAIDIASGYVGQATISTLGTIATGVWQASIIADAYINDALTISGGTVDNSVIGGTTPAAITATQVDITASGDLRLLDSAGGEYVALKASSAISSSYNLTMPAAVGSTGQALRTSGGSGELEWFTPADVGDITSVVAGDGLTGGGTSGDVTLNAIGTADRITVTADAIDIAATYVGQATITTVGTIASGTWQGTAVAKTYVAGSPSGDYVGTSDSQTLTNKTLTTPVISTISNTGALTLPTSTDTLVGRATTDTLTNKTLTTPVIGTISNTGSLTLPTSTDTLVGRATTDTLTNKTLTSPVLNGSLSGTGFLDENDLVSNSQVAAASQASIKTYVDSVASGLDLLDSVHVASTAALTVTYANGSSGVGATLTNAGTQAALSIDGQTLVATERVLIKDQAAALQNGIYTVTNIGSGSSNWVLTRSTDFDTGAELDSGSFVFVETGTTNADSGWVMTTDGTISVGTTSINWTQFSKAADILAGDGLTKTGSTIDAIGTSNRISVNGNIDIDAAYVGQTSITTLGTITSGIWQGTAIADTYVTDALTISGGTINNSVIGGSTPAAISATTLSVSSTSTFSDAMEIYARTAIGSGAGDAAIDDNFTTGGLDVVVANGTKAFQVWDDNQTAEPRFIVERDGDTGIGTGSPTLRATIVDQGTGALPTDGAVGVTTANGNIVAGVHNTDASATYSGIALETRESGASRWLIANEWQSTYLGDLVFSRRTGGTASGEALRIESSGNVGIGGTPESRLHVENASSGTSIAADGSDILIVENSSSAAIDIRSAAADSGGILFSDPDARARGAIVYYHNSGLDSMYFNTAGSSGQMIIDSGGNIGIGVTPESAWHANYRALDIGTAMGLWGSASGASFTALSDNSYFDGVNYKAKNTAAASQYYQVSGAHWWQSAASVSADANQTFTTAMVIEANGNVALGHTTATGAKFAICDGANAQIQFFPEISTDTNLTQHYDVTSSTYMNAEARAASHSWKIGTGEGMSITAAGEIRVANQTAVKGTNSKYDMIFPDNSGIAIGSAYTFANIYGSSGDVYIRANSYVANTGSNGKVHFQTANSSGGQANDVSVEAGNLVFGNGNGINFAAASSGGAGVGSTTLDEYENGTWTPQLIAGTTNPTGGANIGANGEYMRIGNRVWVTFYIGVSWTNSPAGGIFISGLPFTVNAGRAGFFPVATYNVTYGDGGIPWIHGDVSDTTCSLYASQSGADWIQMTFNGHASSSAGLYVAGGFNYLI